MDRICSHPTLGTSHELKKFLSEEPPEVPLHFPPPVIFHRPYSKSLLHPPTLLHLLNPQAFSHSWATASPINLNPLQVSTPKHVTNQVQIHLYHLDLKIDQWFDAKRNYITSLESQLTAMEHTVSLLVKRQKDLSQSYNDISTNSSLLSSTEVTKK